MRRSSGIPCDDAGDPDFQSRATENYQMEDCLVKHIRLCAILFLVGSFAIGISLAVGVAVPQAPPASSIMGATPVIDFNGGNYGMPRYLQYLFLSHNLTFKPNESWEEHSDLRRQVRTLESLRTKLRDLDREFGPGPLSLVKKDSKTTALLTFMGYEKIPERIIEPAGGEEGRLRRMMIQRAGVDIELLVQRLRAGQEIDLHIPYFDAKLPDEQTAWFKDALHDPSLTSDRILPLFLTDWNADLLYMALVRMDEPARQLVRRSIGLRQVYLNRRLLWGLFNFGDSLIVDSSDKTTRIRLPGMPSLADLDADQNNRDAFANIKRLETTSIRIWSELLGCSVDDPEKLIHHIFENATMAYFYDVMSKQPTAKQQILLGVNLPPSEAISFAHRLFESVRLPYPSAYDAGRMDWSRRWDFQDLVTLVDVDEHAGIPRILGSPQAWHMALESSGGSFHDERDVEDIRRKLPEDKQQSISPLESFLCIAERLNSDRGDILLANRISPVQAFEAIQAIFGNDPQAAEDVALVALYWNFERYGAAYRLVQGIPLGGLQQRIINFLIQMQRIDRIQNREVRNTTVKIFQSLLRMIQLVALHGRPSDDVVQQLFDRLMALPVDGDSGFGYGAGDCLRSFFEALGCPVGGDTHGTLVVALTGSDQPIDVPLERPGVGIYYYRYDPARIAAAAAANFLSQQKVSRIDEYFALEGAFHQCRDLSMKMPDPKDAVRGLESFETEVGMVLEGVDELPVPDTSSLRRLVQEQRITGQGLSVPELQLWASYECDPISKELIDTKTRIIRISQGIQEEFLQIKRLIESQSKGKDSKNQYADIRKHAEKIADLVDDAAGPLDRILSDTLLGYIYAECIDPRYPVKSGIVIGHCFDQSGGPRGENSNPWADGERVDLTWNSGQCTEKGVVSGSVDYIPFAMREYRLGQILDLNASSSRANSELQAQFSAICSLPSAMHMTDEGLRFVTDCYGLGASAVAATDPASRQIVMSALKEIVGPRRFAVLQTYLHVTGIGEEELTPSEVYMLGIDILKEADRAHLEKWAAIVDPVHVARLLNQWKQVGVRASVRELIGIPMRRTTGSIGLVDEQLLPYEFFELDSTGGRVVERINPRILLCVMMSRMNLPSRLQPALQPALLDRILNGSRELYATDWLTVEEAARRVTTETTLREIVESLTRGPNPILTAD